MEGQLPVETPPRALEPTRSDAGDGSLLAIQAATLFVLTQSGRIRYENDPERSLGPRLFLAGCDSGNVVRIRHDVGEGTARAIDALVADEPLLRDREGPPLHRDDYVALLATEAPVEQRSTGVIYYFPDRLKYEHDVTLVSSDTPEGDRLHARLADQGMPQAIVALGFVEANDLWAPWCVALHEGEIASIALTARISPIGAEVGVITVPALRGSGFAAAATASWASLQSLRGRVLFYSTEQTNVSSQHVTDRLRLRYLGASLRVT